MPTVMNHSGGSQPSIPSESVLEEGNGHNERPRPLSCFIFSLFLCNAFVIVGIGEFGLFSLPTTRAISEQYPTLITPVLWVAPVVWAVLLLSQGAWAVAQLLPAYRNSPLVKDGIHHYYIGVVLSQLVWTCTFSFEIVYVSLLSGLSMFVFLCLIMHDQDKINPSTYELWIFEFPFSLYAGWTGAVVLWNTSVVLVNFQVSETAQFIVASVSVAVMGVVSVWASLVCSNYTVSIVLAFCTTGISVELDNPAPEILQNFHDDQIVAINMITIVIVIATLVAAILHAVIHVLCTKRQDSAMMVQLER